MTEIFLIAATALNLMFLNLLVQKSIIAVPRRWIFALTLLNTAIVVLHLVTQRVPSTFVWWLFHVNFEYNAGALFSSLLLLSTGLLALTIAAVLRGKLRLSIVWLIWGAAYLFFSYDELYSFHEQIAAWALYYVILGLIIVGAAVYAGLFVDQQHFPIYLLLIFGLGVTAAGGVFIEKLPIILVELEEFLELSGTIFVLAATYTYFRRRLSDRQWQQTRRLLVRGSIAWAAVLIGVVFWPLPEIEARYLAQPAFAEYLGGDLILLGYQVDERPRHAGERIRVTQYWRASRPLAQNYAQSVRLLNPRTGAALAQADVPLGPPTLPTTDAWFPGMVYKKTFYLVTDSTLPAPARYWLSLSVWRTPWDPVREDNMLLIDRTDREMVLPDTLILGQVVFLSSDALPDAPASASYHFDNAMRLKGYALPTGGADDADSLRFWWELDARVDQELIQFLHAHDVEDDTIYVFDQPPLPELPTTDWPAGMQAVSQWGPEQLRDLPDGQYELFTGLYELTTMERIGVSDASGAAVPDNRIYLGTLIIGQ